MGAGVHVEDAGTSIQVMFPIVILYSRFLKVPAGSPPQLFKVVGNLDFSGLDNHKVHDNPWIALPTDPKRRELHRPSTAAARDLAATGAVAARSFAQYDQAFAQQCLQAATTAYAAAKRHPAILAPGTACDLDGGAYSDDDVDDDFYWAAAELYLTTGQAQYLEDLSNNSHHSANVSTFFSIPDGFPWASVAAVSQLDLTTILSNISNHSWIVQSVLDAADMLLAVQRNQTNGYRVLLNSSAWGSNSNNMNNIQIVATAYDLTGNTTYRNAAVEAIEYALGRNADAQSYVRGYGTKTLRTCTADSTRTDWMTRCRGILRGRWLADDVLQAYVLQLCYVIDVNSITRMSWRLIGTPLSLGCWVGC